MGKKVNVNSNCIGCGACMAICSEVFDMNDSGVAYVKMETDCSSISCVKDAKDACPVGAIECE